MGQAKLIRALIENFDDNEKKLADLTISELLEVAGGLAAETSGSISMLSGKALYALPRELLRRGAEVVPLLERVARRELGAPRPHVDLGFMVVGPLARLLSASGRSLDPAFDDLFSRVVAWRPFDVAEWLGALPLERRLPIVKLALLPKQGRSGMPTTLLAACPHPEIVGWTFATVSAWKRDRDEMKKQSARRRLVETARAFSAGAFEPTLDWLRATDLGPYRAPFVRGLGAAPDGALAAAALVAELAGKPEVAEAAAEALRELAERFPEETRTALREAAGSKGVKLKAAAARVLATLRGSDGKQLASPIEEPPHERVSRLEAALPKERIEAVLAFYEDADYSAPFAWESLKDDEPALLVGLIAWGRIFFPIQGRIGGEWFDRRWRDPFKHLGRPGGEVAELAPWAAAEAFGFIRQAEVTATTLDAYLEAFPGAADPLARIVREKKPAGRHLLIKHLASVDAGKHLDLLLEGAADKTRAVAEVCAPIVAGLGKRHVPALQALTGSKKKAVREGAQAALAKLRP